MKSAIKLITGSNTACKRSVAKLREVFAADHIYRGNPDISDYENATHRAERGIHPDGYPVVHIDDDFLRAATTRGLAGLLAHEGFHLAGYKNHKSDETYPYTTFPYSIQSQCVG